MRNEQDIYQNRVNKLMEELQAVYIELGQSLGEVRRAQLKWQAKKERFFASYSRHIFVGR